MQKFRDEIYKLNPYVPGEQPPARSRIVKLNTNENPYPPSPLATSAGKKVLEEGILRRYPQPTSENLRLEFAKIYKINPDMVLVTNGSDEAIRLLFAGILKSGSILGYPDPTYSAYPVFADTTLEDVSIQKFPLDEDLGFPWKEMRKSQADLIAFANPNAPTGILEDKKDIMDFLDHFHGFTLCDEAYIDYAQQGSSMIQQVRTYKNLFVSRTLSKSYSLAGLRVGFLIGNPEWIELLHKIKDSYNIGLLDQEIAKSALEDQEYFQNCRAKVITTRIRVQKVLESWGFVSTDSSTNFLFVKPPKNSVQANELFLKLKEMNIYVRYFDQGISSEYLRISIGTDEEMDSFLEGIRSILHF